ncbi:MAG: glycosyltransferase [Chloroflexota bacterium]|nr:glycosyltransferase [Chloroflexota bacterium]
MSTHPFASAAEPDANSLPGEKASSAGDPGTGEKHTSIRHSRESGNPSSTDVLTGITAVVLTRNVAAEIAPCLAALAWADSIVVVDDFSSDDTRAICERNGARVVERRLESFAAQRNFALTHVQTPWVLFIDSDERVSPALAEEICAAVRDDAVAGYWIPRKNLFGGRWVKHAGWSPDYQLRLFRVAKGRYDPSRFAHETVLLDGPDAHLTERLTHYNYSSVRQFLAKQRRYAQLEARHLWLVGQRVHWRNYVLQPLRAFKRRFFTWRGYAEGWLGFALSAAMAYYEWRAYRHLAALEKDPTTRVWQEFRALPAATCAVSVVIVSYNVADLLAAATGSVLEDLERDGIDGEVIVVDNASADGSAAAVRESFPSVRLITNATNVGFGRAANQGMLAAQGELAVVLNPDASVQPGFFVAIQDYLAHEPHVGLVGPHLVQADGTTQLSCRRSYTLATAFLESTPLQWWFGETPDLRRFYCRDLDAAQAAKVDWVEGACLIARREVMQAVGGFDPRFFMYFEETDWCGRIKEAGWDVAYFPGAQVLHHRSRSADQDLIARALNFHRSRHAFLVKERGRLVALLLRAIIGLLFAVYTMQQAAKTLVKRQNQELRRNVAELGHVTLWYLTGFSGRRRHPV